jgi:hypothetical protein
MVLGGGFHASSHRTPPWRREEKGREGKRREEKGREGKRREEKGREEMVI